METPRIIRLVDRTRTVADWRCPRARWWGYEWEGRGLRSGSTSLELSMGIVIHDALAGIATLQKEGLDLSIDDIAVTAYKQMFESIIADKDETPDLTEFASEQATLVEGLIRGFHKHVWPRLLAAWPHILKVEGEMEFALAPDLIFMAKPDLLLGNDSGEVLYVEYKSTSSKKDKWVTSWDTAVQLHSSIRAVEVTMGKAPDAVQIVGLYKGYESYGKQSSPFCYAYKKAGNPPFTTDTIAYDYKPGFRRTPIWELTGGCKKWVEDMPSDILATQFPMTAPIFINDDLVDKFFRQRATREAYITQAGQRIKDGNEALDDILDEVYPQHFDQCVPAYGFGCEFKNLCHSYVSDPLEAGFNLREPHHAREMELLQHEQDQAL